MAMGRGKEKNISTILLRIKILEENKEGQMEGGRQTSS